MKKLAIILFLLNPFLLFSQISPTPSWIKTIEAPSALNMEKDEFSTGWVYLLRDIQINVESRSTFYHFVIEVVTSSGLQEASHLEVSFDPAYQQIRFHEFSVIRNSEKKYLHPQIQSVKREKNMDRFLYDGNETQYIDLEDIRVGDIITYKYSVEGENPIYQDHFFTEKYTALSVYIQKLFLLLKTDNQRNINIAYENEESRFLKTVKDNTILYELSKSEVSPVEIDDNLPVWYTPYPYVSVSDLSMRDLVNWANKLFDIKNYDIDQLQKEVNTIKQEYESEEEIILACLKFVQNEIRYLGNEAGIGAYLPQSPDRVLRQRHGDCKDKSLLFTTLLNMMNIEAFPVLTHTSIGTHLPEHLPSPLNFNHCIAQVKAENKTFWFDPTLTQQEGNLENRYTPQFGYVLVVDGKSRDFRKIETNGKSEYNVLERFISEDFSSPIILRVTTEYLGYDADLQRSIFNENSLNEIQDNYLNHYSNYYPKIRIKEDLTFDDNDIYNVFIVYEEYEITDFWKKEGDQYSVNIYPGVFESSIHISESRFRKHPMGLNYPFTINHKIICELPEQWNIQDSHDKISNSYFDFSNSMVYHDEFSKLEIDYTFSTLTDHVRVDDLNSFFDDYNSINELLGVALTYSNSVSITQTGINWFFIFWGLLTVIGSIILARNIYSSYDPKVEYKVYAESRIGGWLILVAFGLFISPFITFYSIFSNNYLTSNEIWQTISNINSGNFSLGWSVFLLFEFTFKVVMIVFTILVFILFLKRRSSTINLIIVFFSVNFVYVLYEFIVVNFTEINVEYNILNNLLRSFITAGIWIPYFMFSERVRDTFVKRYNIS